MVFEGVESLLEVIYDTDRQTDRQIDKQTTAK